MEISPSSQSSHDASNETWWNAFFDKHSYALIAILIAIILSGTLLAWTGRWSPILEPDSTSYLDFDWSSLERILSGIRTPLYPAFVQLAKSTFGISSIPRFHFGMMSLAVVGFYFGLTSVGFRPWAAAASAAPLCFSRGLWDFGARLGSDALGIAMGVGCASFFLMAISKYSPRYSPNCNGTHSLDASSIEKRHSANSILTGVGWIALGCMTLATILVRPAYLFLIPLWPVLAFTLLPWIWRRTWKEAFHTAMKSALVAALPLLAYCGFRWTVVQEFGLVSFAGYNLIGITGQYVDRDDIDHLPDESQELAKRLVDVREEAGFRPVPLDYRTMVDLYNKTAWETAAPASEAIYGNDTKKANRALQSLALSSLRLHPREYLYWLQANSWSMLQQLARGTVLDVGSRISVCVLGIWVGIHGMKRGFRPIQRNTLDPSTPPKHGLGNTTFEIGTLVWVSILFAAAKGLLVVLVEPALGRYVVAVGCFFPACVGLFAAIIGQRFQYEP